MFGRVHDIPLGLYMHRPSDPMFAGIRVGKKWSGSYGTGSTVAERILSESGWLEVSQADVGLNITLPEYSMPSKLPEWVNAYNPSTHPYWTGNFYGERPRYLLGDGTNSIGPYTLPEVLSIYSTMKRHIPVGGSDGSNSDSPVYSNGEFSENNPYWLFDPTNKNSRSVVYGGGINEIYMFPPTSNGSNNKVYVAVDVDKLNDYYIVGNSLFFDPFYFGSVDNSNVQYAVRAITSWSETAAGLNIVKTQVPSTGSEQTCSCTFSSGSTSKSFTMYGWRFEPPEEDPPLDPAPDLPTSLSFKATEFWPYKTASGQPVYNTTTGAIVNSPLS